MANKKSTESEQTGDPYFFPEHQITVYAKSREEAEKQLDQVIKDANEGNEDTP